MPAAGLAIYWYPGTCARVPLIALEDIGVPFEARLAPRRHLDADAFAWYKRDVNPKGKVPALVADDQVITENPAILTFLDRRFPAARLLPEDSADKIDALTLMSWFAAGVHPLLTRARFPNFVSESPDSFDSVRKIALDELRECIALLDARLDGRESLFDRWSVVDGYLTWIWFRAVSNGLTGEEFPNVDASARLCEERPSVARVLDRETETYAELERAGLTRPGATLVAGRLPALPVS